jgi:uncharacterized RDD family membrane protein YckC
MMAGRTKKQADDGFVSSKAKEKLTRVAIISGVIFFVLQIILPIAFVVPVFIHAAKKSPDNKYVAYASAIWKGDTWAVAETGKGKPSTLVKKSLDSKRVETVASFDMPGDCFLLVDPSGERLWLISGDKSGYVDQGGLHWLQEERDLGDIGRAFFVRGLPAAMEYSGETASIWVLEKEHWRKEASAIIRMPTDTEKNNCGCLNLKVAWNAGNYTWFFKNGRHISFFTGLPSARNANADAWPVLTDDSADKTWFPSSVNGGMLLLDGAGGLGRSRGHMRIWRLDQGHWTKQDILADSAGSAVLQALENQEYAVLFTGPDLQMRRLGEKRPGPKTLLLSSSRHSELWWFAGFAILLWTFLMIGPFVLLGIMSRQIALHRKPYGIIAGRKILYATLWQRAWARILDSVIFTVPILVLAGGAGFALALWGPGTPADGLTHTVSLLIFFALLFLVLTASGIFYIYLEGSSGLTPGRKWMGIQLVNRELQPCGFWKAFLRTLAGMADSFGQWLLGILFIAFSKHQQRLGDLAAETLVVQSASLAKGRKK